MININNKQFRNLQEQVAFLTSMIGQATDVVKKIVGVVATVNELPDVALYSPGDTFAVGAESPYEYYVKINNAWVDIGKFPAEGPAGNDGNDGKSVILYTGNADDSSTTYLPIADLLVADNLNVADIIFTGKGNVYIIEGIETLRVKVLYKFNIKPVISFDNVALTGTTTAENITVSGTLTINDATSANEAVSKGQMDTALDGKLDKVETAGSGVYSHNGSTQGQIPYNQSAVSGTIVQRTATGNVKAADPIANDDAATKHYVDTTHPVTSVNTKTGDVVLSASDILTSNSQTVQASLDKLDNDKADKAGDFTLIETIALTSDTELISRTGYDYKELLFRFTVPASSRPTETGQFQFGSAVAWLPMLYRSDRVCKINYKVKCDGGLMFCDYGATLSNTPQNISDIPYRRPAGWMGSFSLSNITSFQFGIFNTTIPAGTVIEIYAR